MSNKNKNFAPYYHRWRLQNFFALQFAEIGFQTRQALQHLLCHEVTIRTWNKVVCNNIECSTDFVFWQTNDWNKPQMSDSTFPWRQIYFCICRSFTTVHEVPDKQTNNISITLIQRAVNPPKKTASCTCWVYISTVNGHKEMMQCSVN